MFPTEIGQRVRVNYETGVSHRGESGYIKSIDGKYFNIEFEDGIFKLNKIYLSVIEEPSIDYINKLSQVRDFVIGNIHNFSISQFCSDAYAFCYKEFGVVPFKNDDIKELAIKFVKGKKVELNREMIWD